jgi:radical SAM superfamily enzyme YgiQ (UPF0313 family)
MIDAVVRGYGEKPVLALLEALRDKKGLEQIQNLTWREGNSIRQNKLSYIGDTEIISELNFTNFSLLRHPATYIRHVGLPFFFAKHFTVNHLKSASFIFYRQSSKKCLIHLQSVRHILLPLPAFRRARRDHANRSSNI